MIISKFKRSRKSNYDFLVKAGKGFQNSVFKFCKVMIEDEKYPESFKKTTLHMILKVVEEERKSCRIVDLSILRTGFLARPKRVLSKRA